MTILGATVIIRVDDAVILDETLEIFSVVEKCPKVARWPLWYQKNSFGSAKSGVVKGSTNKFDRWADPIEACT